MFNTRKHTKVYTRVEHRSDYVEPENTVELLDILESTGDLRGVLSPLHVHERMLVYYLAFDGATRAERKVILQKAWNLSRPTLHQVIRKFRSTIDVYPNIRDEIMGDCSLKLIKIFDERKFLLDKNTRMTSYLFEMYKWTVMGCLTRHFKGKEKYIPVDPLIMGKVCDADYTPPHI